jgi:hypothetical protein
MRLQIGEAGVLKPGVNLQFCGERRRRNGVWRSYSVVYANRNGVFEDVSFADVCVHPAGGKKLSDRQARAEAKRIVAAQRGWR